MLSHLHVSLLKERPGEQFLGKQMHLSAAELQAYPAAQGFEAPTAAAEMEINFNSWQTLINLHDKQAISIKIHKNFILNIFKL